MPAPTDEPAAATPPLRSPAAGVSPRPAAALDHLPSNVDVLIAGAGPVGSALAIELAQRGIRPLVIERRHEIQTANVRARNISIRTLELARRWGIAQRFRDAQTLPSSWQRGFILCTRVAGPELAEAVHRDEPMWTPNAPWHTLSAEPPQDLPQYHVNRILRDRARELGATVATGWQVDAVVQDDEGVTVTARSVDHGTVQEIRADYVVAADGARSAVRRTAGIGQSETPPQGLMLNVSFRFPGGFDALGVTPGINFMVFNQEVSGLAHPYEEDWWRIGVGPLPLDTDVDSIDLQDQIDKFFGIHAEVDSISFTQHLLQKRIVDTHRLGRVLVAGDAAVAFPPHLGQNLNTGVADAAALGWLLAARLQGWGGDRLLDASAFERHETAGRLADASLGASEGWLEVGARLLTEHALEDDSDEGAAVRASLGASISKLIGESADGLMFDHRYADSPIVVPGDVTAPAFEPDRYSPAALAGHVAPHVWLSPDDPLSDHFGLWFTLLDLDADRDDVVAIERAAALAGLPLTVASVTNSAVRAAYGSRLVLIRPDRIIAWSGDRSPNPAGQLIDTVRGADLAPTARPDARQLTHSHGGTT